MGKLILRDCYLAIDGVDLSNRASAVAIDNPSDEVNLDTFGGEYHETGRGLRDATITPTFIQDFDEVDPVLHPLNESGDMFLVQVRAHKAAASSSNPEIRMYGRLYNYNPLGGSVGEASTTDIPIRNADTVKGIWRVPS